MTIAPTGVGQILVNAVDLDRAVAFYKDVLGLKHLFTAPPGLAFFDCGGVRLMLARPEGRDTDHAASIIYYKVSDIHAYHAQLTRKGVKPLAEPHRVARMPDHDLWLADYKDSEGNIFAVMHEVRPPAKD